MRRAVITVMLALLASTVHAQAVSIVLTVGQWIVQSHRKLYYVEVESSAADFQLAKDEGFRTAVEHAVGSLILSESESTNLRLTRNSITNYSSGYVDQFKIVERRDNAGNTTLRMQVWVAHSSIADRLLNQSKHAGAVEGNTIATQAATLTNQRQTGDRVLSTVLADYPHRAFNVKLESTRAVYDSNRQVQLQVPFVLEWNKPYLNSLEETLKVINHYPRCNTANDACKRALSRVELHVNYLQWNPGAWFNDEEAWRIMLDQMVIQRPVYKLTLHTVSGNRINYCYRAPELDESEYRTAYFTNFGRQVTKINGLHSARIVLIPQVDQKLLTDLTQATVEVVRQSECR